jgi:hypothetical protein
VGVIEARVSVENNTPGQQAVSMPHSRQRTAQR